MVKFSSRSSLFDSAGTEYVSMGDVLGFERTEAFTLSFWAKWSTASSLMLLGKIDVAPTWRGYEVYALASGALVVALISDNATTNQILTQTTETGFNDDKWHHIVVAYSGSSSAAGISIFVDASLKAQTVTDDALTGTILNAGNFIVGSRTALDAFYTGRIDEVAVYDAELSAAEVTVLHNSHLPPDLGELATSANLVGWWRMGEWATSPIIQDVARRVQHPANNDPNLTTALYLNSTIDPDSATNGYNQNASFGNVAEMNFGPTDPFTIGIWVRTNDVGTVGAWGTTGSKTLFSKIALSYYAGTDEGWRFYTVTGGRIGFVFGSSTSNYLAAATVDNYCDGFWHLLTVTYDGSGNISGLQLFIDGEAVDVTTGGSGTVSGDTTTTQDLVVGAAGTYASEGYFHARGLFCHSFGYDVELTPAEVALLYTDGKPQDLSGLAHAADLVHWSRLGDGCTLSTKSLQFSGNTRYCYANAGSILGFEYTEPFSLVCWFRTTDTSAYIISKQDGTANLRGYFLYMASGELMFGLRNTSASDEMFVVTTDGPYNDDAWHHVVATWDGNVSPGAAGVTIYVDGVQATTSISSDTLTGTVINAGPFNFCTYNSTASNCFDGYLDEVAVYSKELSLAEVTAIYNGGVVPNVLTDLDTEPYLVGWWRMGDEDDQVFAYNLYDYSANNYLMKASSGTGIAWDFESPHNYGMEDLSPLGNDGRTYGVRERGLLSDTPPIVYSTPRLPLTRSLDLNNDTVNEYVDFGPEGYLHPGAPFTIGAWIKTTMTTEGAIVGRGRSEYAAAGYLLDVTAAGALIIRRQHSGTVEYLQWSAGGGFTALNDGEWHFVAFSRRAYWPWSYNIAGEFYIDDASSIDLFKGSGSGGTYYVDGTNRRVGARYASASYQNHFVGQVCHAFIYDKELTEFEIAEIRGGGSPQNLTQIGPAENLIFWSGLGDGDAVGAGAVQDLSGHGNDGTFVNGESGDFLVDAPFHGNPGTMTNMDATNYSLDTPIERYSLVSTDFDGTDDRVLVGDELDFDGTAPFSISCWFKTSTAGSGTLVGKVESSGNYRGYFLWQESPGYISFTINNVNVTNSLYVYTPSASYNDGNWHHCVVTYRGDQSAANTEIYIDGENVSAITYRDSLSATASNTVDLEIGRSVGVGGAFTGNIDDVAIYDKELTALEVKQLFGWGQPNSPSGYDSFTDCVAWWRMGDGDTYPTLKDDHVARYSPLTTSIQIATDGGGDQNEAAAFPDPLALPATGQAFTMGVWIKNSGSATNRCMISKNRTTTGRTWALYAVNTPARVEVSWTDNNFDRNYSIFSPASTILDGSWHQVVWTYDGVSTHQVYVDGSSVSAGGGGSESGGLSGSDSAGQLTVGGVRTSSSVFDSFYQGRLCHSFLYDKVLSGAEVAAIYGGGVPQDLSSTGPTANLKHWCACGDGDGLGTGNMIDLSGEGNNGTFVAGESNDFVADVPMLATDGTMTAMAADDIEDDSPHAGFSSIKSVIFDGANEYATGGNVLDWDRDQARSWSFWIKTTTVAGGYLITKQQAGNPEGWHVAVNGSGQPFIRLVKVWLTDMVDVSSSISVSDGDWHHVVVTWSGSTGLAADCKMYVDGDEDTSLSINTNNLTGSISNSAAFQLADRQLDQGTAPFDGNLDEVAIYNRVLTPAEIEAIWAAGELLNLFDLSTFSNLVAWWRMGDGDTHPTLQDAHPSGNDLAMTNMEAGDIVEDASERRFVAYTADLVETVTGPSESVGAQYGADVDHAPTVILIEETMVSEGEDRDIAEGIVVSEAVTAEREAIVNIAESVPLSEALVTIGAFDLALAEAIPFSATGGGTQPQSVDIAETVLFEEDLDITVGGEIQLALIDSEKTAETVTFQAVFPEEMGFSPRVDDVSTTSLSLVSPNGGVPLQIQRVTKEYGVYHSGASGYLLNTPYTPLAPPGQAYPVSQFALSIIGPGDRVGDYLEIMNGSNKGLYRITGAKTSDAIGPQPLIYYLDRILPVSDPPNGYVQGSNLDYLGYIIIPAGGGMLGGTVVQSYRMHHSLITAEDPLVGVDFFELRDPRYNWSAIIGTNWSLSDTEDNVIEIRYSAFYDVPHDWTGLPVFAIGRVSPKVQWRIISGVTGYQIRTSKPTGGKSYELSARSLRTKEGQLVDMTGYTLVDLVDVQLPRAIAARLLGDEGTVLVDYDQPMQSDAATLFNPADYSITGPSDVTIHEVHAYGPTTVALQTSGLGEGDYTMVISTGTPKDIAGNPIDPLWNSVVFTSSPPLTIRSLFTDKGPITKPELTIQSGVNAVLESFTEVTLPGATLTTDHIGKYLRLSGGSLNGGSFRVTSIVSTTRARVQASFTLPDPASGSLTWELYDPQHGLIADDPSDVTVRVNSIQVTPEAVIGLLGQIVLNAAPTPTDDVQVDYSWCCNPTVDLRRLNSREFRLNAWNRDQGYPNDLSQHKYRFNNVLVVPSEYEPLDPRATLDQPELREMHYRAYERAYTPVLNDPSLLLLNSPIHKIAYPPAQRTVEEEFVAYEGTGLPEAQVVNPWTREGAGSASSLLGRLTVIDDSGGEYPTGQPIFWTRTIDLTFPHVFAMSWRFYLDVVAEFDGVFSGVAAGYSDEEVAAIIGFLEDGGVKKIGVLKRGYGDDPAVATAWTGGLDSSSNPTNAATEFDWSVLHSYRVLRDLDGVIKVFVDGDIDPLLQVTEDELPFLVELAAPFDAIQGAFFGSISRPARSTSVWDFVRYLIQPTNPLQTSPSSFVSYEANVVPEADAKPWTPVGYHGTETIISSDFLLLDSTSASDVTDVGLMGGDYRGFLRFEPLLTRASEYVLDANVQLRTLTHGVDPDGLMFAIDDGERLMQVCLFADQAAPKISYGGRSFPGDFTPYSWSSMGTQTAGMAGRILRITDTSVGDGLVYYYDDTNPVGSDDRVVASTIDYILEFRCEVVSYTPDGSGFIGVFSQVFDGTRVLGALLWEVAGTRYVALHSDGVVLSQFAFEWNDSAPHTYRLTKNTSGDLVSLFVDGTYIGSQAYSSFTAPAPSTTGQVSFGSSTPASAGAESVVDWHYCNAWRVLASFRRFCGLYKGSDGDTLLGYHLPLKTSGRGATAVGNALGDGNADFVAAGVVSGDQLVVDDGPNRGVHEVVGVAAQSLTLTAAWPHQPSLVDYRIVKETDWSVQHQYRLTRDSTGQVTLLLDTDPDPLILVGYNSIDLPPSSAGIVRTLSGGLPALAWGSFNVENLAQSNWDYVRYGITRSPTEMRIAPHHEVINQWNVMHSPERLYTTLPHTLTDFKSSSTGQPPKTDPDFLADAALLAFTQLNEGTPIVPQTQTFEVRAPYPVEEFVSALNRPEDVLNNDADFTLNDGSIRYRLIVPDDILYSSLDIIEQAEGEQDLIKPFGECCQPNISGLTYTDQVCLTYDADVLPEDDTAAPTAWHLLSDDPLEVSATVFASILTYGTASGGTRTVYRNDTPLPDAPGLPTEARWRFKVLADSTLGTGDSQIRVGLSAPGLTVALAFVTTPLAERVVYVLDANNGNILGSATFDFLDGNYHTYRLVRDPGAGVVQFHIDS